MENSVRDVEPEFCIRQQAGSASIQDVAERARPAFVNLSPIGHFIPILESISGTIRKSYCTVILHS
jgi:hypothetical protein